MNAHNELLIKDRLTSALIMIFHGREILPTQDEVSKMAKEIAPTMSYEGDVDAIVEEVLTKISTRMGTGVSLIDVKADHDDRWVSKRSDIDWTYSEAYAEYLKHNKWNPHVVQKLSDVGDNILRLLQDPESDGAWNRKGLVIGHVQSGKTANYLGVIGKAADAGYKFIIVISGIHNNLRKQTQERIDSGFVGRSSDPDNRIAKGVGELIGVCYPNPVTVTNIYKDFDKSIANRFGTRLTDFSKPFVLVIKKNVYTLQALYTWLKDLNASKDGRISDVPMLMIDDEADLASINTNKEELDPTKTNALIRKINGLFDKFCYVGYTATPFANVFINPVIYGDLFPKDFIYCLDAPSHYFGPNKVFIEENSSEKILEPIMDAEEYIPLIHKKEHEVFDLPPSLYNAIRQFIVAKAIRNLRGQKDEHCSMMINVSRFIAVQSTVRDFVSSYITSMKNAVQANYKMPEHISSGNTFMASLKSTFDESFGDCPENWEGVKSSLYSAFETVRVLLVNSHSQDSLDYASFESDGGGLTAIAVGGLSLSRGLTIEGLCVSYMYRNTRVYDTLMQMGRWFGYRSGYEDLCKIHLNEDSINWYAHIAEASEELRSQIKQMRRDKLSPKQFGLYVKRHPERLLITSVSKMRSAQELTLEYDFSGRIVESHILSQDTDVIEENTVLLNESLKTALNQGADRLKPTGKGWAVNDVPIEEITNFIKGFNVHESWQGVKMGAIDYIQKIADRYPLGDVLFISRTSNKSGDEEYSIGAQNRKIKKLERNEFWMLTKGRVASRGDEKLGLTDGQVKEAERQAREEDHDKNFSDFHYRSVRCKPLLMLHLLRVEDESSDAPTDIPAFGISFPSGDFGISVEVVANQVYIKNRLGDLDDPDDEEDYDAPKSD